jgi:hypothetical protein
VLGRPVGGFSFDLYKRYDRIAVLDVLCTTPRAMRWRGCRSGSPLACNVARTVAAAVAATPNIAG